MVSKNLAELDLGNNAVSLGGAQALKPILSQLTSLKVLKLNNTGVGMHGGQVGICSCTGLMLSQIIAKALLAGSKDGVLGACGLFVIHTGMRLTTFVLGRSQLRNPGAKALAAVFNVTHLTPSAISYSQAMGTLEVISMPQNGIRRDGILALAG